MKLTLYSKSGKVLRESECESFNPHCGEYRIVVFKYSPASVEDVMNGCRGYQEWIVTNLPMVAEGKDATTGFYKQEPKPEDKGCLLRLLNDAGELIREWKEAKSISYYSGIVFFWSSGEWFSVCGNVVQSDGVSW